MKTRTRPHPGTGAIAGRDPFARPLMPMPKTRVIVVNATDANVPEASDKGGQGTKSGASADKPCSCHKK